MDSTEEKYPTANGKTKEETKNLFDFFRLDINPKNAQLLKNQDKKMLENKEFDLFGLLGYVLKVNNWNIKKSHVSSYEFQLKTNLLEFISTKTVYKIPNDYINNVNSEDFNEIFRNVFIRVDPASKKFYFNIRVCHDSPNENALRGG